jgi:hypothetical protein
MNKIDLASRLQWANLLGFSNIRESRGAISGRKDANLGAKIGSKEGSKPFGLSQLGTKIGTKPGLKPVDLAKLGAKIGGKIGQKTGFKPDQS